MRILLIRHGDPDYVHDTLTEKGHKEAALLAEKMEKLPVTDFYVSPLGRAKDTASYTLKKLGREAKELEWLREFPEYFTADGWRSSEAARCSDMVQVYDRVIEGLDQLLKEYGYVREGAHYRAVQANEDTVVFFCHFGVSCVLLSHLWNVSPFILWHSLAMAPTSVTELVTEERNKGCTYFRGLKVGDISHLYAGNEEPSFACRFCETYGSGERH